MTTRKQYLEQQVAIITDNVSKRKVRINELQDELDQLNSQNSFDEQVGKLHKQELSKLK